MENEQNLNLTLIADELKGEIQHYSDVLYETKLSLQLIKKIEEPQSSADSEKNSEPDSILDKFKQLIYQLHELNNLAENNLKHLREIL